jgi:hypothetical protein
MQINEYREVRDYLENLIDNEEKKFFSRDTENFYKKYKVEFYPIAMTNACDEVFFLVLRFKEYGIYFNDVEEVFGICEIHDNKCINGAEFFDNLAPTIGKLMDFDSL